MGDVARWNANRRGNRGRVAIRRFGANPKGQALAVRPQLDAGDDPSAGAKLDVHRRINLFGA